LKAWQPGGGVSVMESKAFREKSDSDLFRMYHEETDDQEKNRIRQEITMRYLYTVRSVAWQMKDMYTGFTQPEDIINEGVLELMKGIDRYDPDRDSRFDTFVSRRIRGMVIDVIRKNDWMPRSYHRDSRLIDEATDELMEMNGRNPSDEELADYLSMSVTKLRRLRRMSTMVNVLSLDITYDGNNDSILQVPSDNREEQPEQKYMQDEDIRILSSAINRLPEKEKTVISLYYADELNMNQIADVMHLSQPRVSQLHAQAIRRLRKSMAEELTEAS
jgi:RNA polymerase sigma factor for flagellar operon FliA